MTDWGLQRGPQEMVGDEVDRIGPGAVEGAVEAATARAGEIRPRSG